MCGRLRSALRPIADIVTRQADLFVHGLISFERRHHQGRPAAHQERAADGRGARHQNRALEPKRVERSRKEDDAGGKSPPATLGATAPRPCRRSASQATASKARACHMWYWTATMKTSRAPSPPLPDCANRRRRPSPPEVRSGPPRIATAAYLDFRRRPPIPRPRPTP